MSDLFKFEYCLPESFGLSIEKLDELWENLKTKNTSSLLVIKKDKIIYEKYNEGYDSNYQENLTSITKPTIAGMSLLLAMQDKLIDSENYASEFIPAWKEDSKKSKIRIKHLATHTSGIGTNFNKEIEDDFHAYNNSFYLAKEAFPIVNQPGVQYVYTGTSMANLTYAVTYALKQKSNYSNIKDYLDERLMKPLGIEENQWQLHESVFNLDGLELNVSWDGAKMTNYALAKIARLILKAGVWNNNTIISKEIIRKATSHSELPGHAGLVWWVNVDEHGRTLYPPLPRDTIFTSGFFHQMLIIIPSLDVIVVRFGNFLEKEHPALFWRSPIIHLFTPLMDILE